MTARDSEHQPDLGIDMLAFLTERGDVILYRRDEDNRCTRCTGRAWTVGHITAECANPSCGNVIPLANCSQTPLSNTKGN